MDFCEFSFGGSADGAVVWCSADEGVAADGADVYVECREVFFGFGCVDGFLVEVSVNLFDFVGEVKGLDCFFVAFRFCFFDHLGVHFCEFVGFAIYCFVRNPSSFVDCLYCASMHGGDRDTLGAMAGAISGAYLGLEAIPLLWRDKLENREKIERLALELARKAVKSRTDKAGGSDDLAPILNQ